MEQTSNIAATEIIQLEKERQRRKRVVESVPPGESGFRQLVPSSPAGVLPSARESVLPVCSICKDAGYLRMDVPVGHPHFGKPVACRCQQARKNDERRKRLREQSQLDRLSAFQDSSFETFQVWLPGVQEAYHAAWQFVHEPKPTGWLVLVGDNGCGKTHLAVSIARHCLDEGVITLFAVVPDLLDYLRATFAPDAQEHYDEAFLKMREAELLVLDDLGAEQSTPWANEKLFQLLNYRYNARLATVTTTNNLGFAGIENRIRSRLSDRRLVRIVTMDQAQDFRLLMAQDRGASYSQPDYS